RVARTESGGTGHSGAAEAAVAARIPGEVLLVIVLGVIEGRLGGDLRRDPTVPGLRQRLLVLLARRFGGLLLRLAGRVDRGAILRADVVPLAHPLRGIVALPEHAEQIRVRHPLRVEDDENHLRVTRLAGAHLAIGGIFRGPTSLANRPWGHT